mmetsp:Transcript_46230/g.80854  ORF Transcript_46230/g.80854 Transcript_46230/m.80854 type:complete len:489 (+) Transcript_46230:48-1514(+)
MLSAIERKVLATPKKLFSNCLYFPIEHRGGLATQIRNLHFKHFLQLRHMHTADFVQARKVLGRQRQRKVVLHAVPQRDRGGILVGNAARVELLEGGIHCTLCGELLGLAGEVAVLPQEQTHRARRSCSSHTGGDFHGNAEHHQGDHGPHGDRAGKAQSHPCTKLSVLVLLRQLIDDVHVHLKQGHSVGQATDFIVNAALGGVQHLLDDIFSGRLEVRQPLGNGAISVLGSLAHRVHLLVGLVVLRQTHRVDHRQVFALDDFGEVPAECTIGTCEVVNLLELIGLVEDDVQLVIQPSQRVRQDRQRLSRGTRFVGVEKQQYNVGTFGIPPADAFEIVPTVHHCIFTRASHRVAHHGAINHTRSVHNHKVLNGNVGADLQLRVVHQRRAECLQAGEAQFGVANESRSISVHIRRTRNDNRKGIIGGSDTSRLYFPLAYIVDKTRLARGVVAKKKNEGQNGVLLRRLLKRSFEFIIENLHRGAESQALVND